MHVPEFRILSYDFFTLQLQRQRFFSSFQVEKIFFFIQKRGMLFAAM
jgi:hypothetical protein